MSRLTNALQVMRPKRPDLPVINWSHIGHTAPTVAAAGSANPTDKLPKADVVVLTWTTNEWSALDHVFLNSSTPRSATDGTWQHAWQRYSHGAPPDPGMHAGMAPLWGLYRIVRVPKAHGSPLTVLLFKCDTHLAYWPWAAGLETLIGQILDETGAGWIYSIGTAGGGLTTLRLGDVAITNAAELRMTAADNVHAAINHQTFTGTTFPGTSLLETTASKLFVSLDLAVTTASLDAALGELHAKVPGSASFGATDLVNDLVSPGGVKTSHAVPFPSKPLLTTDYYYIASAPDAGKWPVLEMDDAIIACVALKRRVPFAFVRNVSDPLVASTTPSGTTIPQAVRDGWSGAVFNAFSLYTSVNGALTTWALLAG